MPELELEADVAPEDVRPFRTRLPRRVLILRHGSRPNEGADPALDEVGEKSAQEVAALFKRTSGQRGGYAPITGLFCSPFFRALQTAAPVAEALGLQIRVEYGFVDLLARWLHSRDPLPGLRARGLDGLPMHSQIDPAYESVWTPEYPESWHRMWPGDRLGRKKALDRHAAAFRSALDAAGGGSILIVGHAATHDFICDALCPDQHLEEHHTPFCVPHASITEIVEQGEGGWRIESFGLVGTEWLERLEDVAGDPTLQELYARQQRLGELVFQMEQGLRSKMGAECVGVAA